MERKNLIQFDLDQSQARKIISFAITSESKVQIINENENSYFILTLGHLQKIQSSCPQKVLIYLEKPDLIPLNGKIINRNNEQYVNYQDLWFERNFYDLFLAQSKTSLLGVDTDDPDYAPDLDISLIVYTAARNDKKSNATMKEKVRDILNLMYPDLSNDAKHRIIMITNTVIGKKAGRRREKIN